MGKLHSSKALSSSPPPPEHGLSPEPSLPKKASVHFSQSSPVIIPPSVEVEDEEEEQEEEEEQHYVPPPRAIPQAPPQASPSGAEMASALYDFNADGEDELTVKEGERLTILEKDGEEWWKCRNAKGVEGVVPASYLEVGSVIVLLHTNTKLLLACRFWRRSICQRSYSRPCSRSKKSCRTCEAARGRKRGTGTARS